MWPFKRRSEKEKYIESVRKNISRWNQTAKDFSQKKGVSDCIEFILRRVEFLGYLEFQKIKTFDQLRQVIRDVKKESEDRAAMLKQIDFENRKKAAANPELVLPVEPMINDDTPIMCNDCLSVLDYFEKEFSGDDALEFMREMFKRRRLEFIEQMEWMITQVQIDMQKIKEMICRRDRLPNNDEWGKAGDILIPMWETLIELGIKKEIAQRVKYFSTKMEEDAYSELDGLDINNLVVETRAEREMREAMEFQKEQEKENVKKEREYLSGK